MYRSGEAGSRKMNDTTASALDYRLVTRYGPWALVTGAAKGLGAEFSNQLAREGFSLVLVDVDRPALEAQREALVERYSCDIRSVVLDLSRENFLSDLLPQIEGLAINLLVNNAGIAKIGSFLPQDKEFLLSQLHVNTRAVMLLTHEMGNRMLARGDRRGGIIIVSSGAAWAGAAMNANYSATKAYDLIFAESLWDELRDEGIDVLGFMPTVTDTPGYQSERPATGRVAVMSAEITVRQALEALGKSPSLFVDKRTRVIHRILRTVLSRAALIKLGSKSLRSIFREAR